MSTPHVIQSKFVLPPSLLPTSSLSYVSTLSSSMAIATPLYPSMLHVRKGNMQCARVVTSLTASNHQYDSSPAINHIPRIQGVKLDLSAGHTYDFHGQAHSRTLSTIRQSRLITSKCCYQHAGVRHPISMGPRLAEGAP